MRLWHLALAVPLFFALACGDMGGMMGGGGGGDDAEEQDDAEDEDEDEDEEEDEEDEEEDEEEEVVKPRPKPTQQCTTAALQSAAGGVKVTGAPKCVGRWGAADLSNGKRGLFEFGKSWKLVSQGSCAKAPSQICKNLGF